MIEKIKHALEEHCGVRNDDWLLVGVSGGPDSLALLHALYKLGYDVTAAHLNHGLRPEADADAAFTGKFAEGLGIEVVVGQADTQAYAEEERLSIEEAARELRYRFLFAEAEARQAKHVVVGHNADDQAETVLMHLLRGSGLAGLGGMDWRRMTPWHPGIALIRPLLGVKREEILSYCEKHNLQPRDDRSNLDTTFYRNQLRHELLPTLETYNPKVRELFVQMAETVRADHAALEAAVDVLWRECLLEESESHTALKLAVFSQLQLGLQRRLLRRALAVLRPGLRDIGFEAVQRALAIIENPPITKQADLIAGLFIRVEEDRFLIAEWGEEAVREDWPQLVGIERVELAVPGEIEIGNGWWVTAERNSATDELKATAVSNPDDFIVYLDGKGISERLILRRREAGDKFYPLGMRGQSMKMTDFMINVKLLQRARTAWPLVCLPDEEGPIVWVPGYHLANNYKVTDETKEIVELKVKRRKVENE